MTAEDREERLRMLELKVEGEAKKAESQWNEQWRRNRDTEALQRSQADEIQELRIMGARVDENVTLIKRTVFAVAGLIGAYVLTFVFQAVFHGASK